MTAIHRQPPSQGRMSVHSPLAPGYAGGAGLEALAAHREIARGSSNAESALVAAGISAAYPDAMGRQKRAVRFHVAQADVRILLGDLDEHEPSVLYARVFRQLRDAAAHSIQPDTTEIHIAGAHAEPFREWLDRSTVRHVKNGDPVKARAFERVRNSEH